MKVVYNSFHGRFACNPRALYERLADRPGVEHVWLADRRHLDAFPAGLVTVDIDGPEARETLESADVLIANTHTEVEWEKPSGTTYLQTWHGTPLKRIHRDVLWAPEGRLDRLDQDIAKWDLLVSPNAASTPRLRKAFGYDRTIAETGYPRNDVLSSADAEPIRRQLREELGLPQDTQVALYTPTWRDDECFADGNPDIALGLDLESYAAAAADNQALLIRAHYMVTGRTRVVSGTRILDVSYFPDVRDLYLAADLLVTDYSSTMFDFAVTGKPIVYFNYDLERYRDSVRGFYFDLLPDAPGPVVRTTEELAETLADVGSWSSSYAGRYAEFQATYCSLEDGHAGDRVLDLLGLATEASGGATG